MWNYSDLMGNACWAVEQAERGAARHEGSPVLAARYQAVANRYRRLLEWMKDRAAGLGVVVE